MKTFYALIVRGQSYSFAEGSGRGFSGQNAFLQTEAANLVQAFLQIYGMLCEESNDITALKVDGQAFMLGFTAEEWDEVSKADIRIREGYPEKEGIQIQSIRDEPFR